MAKRPLTCSITIGWRTRDEAERTLLHGPRKGHVVVELRTVTFYTLQRLLHSIEGNWLQPPFWKTRFMLVERVDLEALCSSGVPAV